MTALLYHSVCLIWGPIIRRRPAVWTNDCQNAASSFYFCRLWKYRILMSEQCLLRLWRRRLYPNVIQEPRRANEGNVRRPTWTNNARGNSFVVCEALEDLRAKNRGPMVYPAPSETLIGRHCSLHVINYPATHCHSSSCAVTCSCYLGKVSRGAHVREKFCTSSQYGRAFTLLVSYH